tara:strand:+ start:208 stop:492 length:285 start_codon:yes stop_codon:yes gene_type:complete
MPYHYGTDKKAVSSHNKKKPKSTAMKAKSKDKVKDYNRKGLTKAQIKSMDKHSMHHTKTHMNMMAKMMREGMTQKKAHDAVVKLEKEKKKKKKK